MSALDGQSRLVDLQRRQAMQAREELETVRSVLHHKLSRMLRVGARQLPDDVSALVKRADAAFVAWEREDTRLQEELARYSRLLEEREN